MFGLNIQKRSKLVGWKHSLMFDSNLFKSFYFKN